MLYRMKIDPMEWERKDVRWGDTVLVRVFANGEAEIARVLEHERNGEERPARLPQLSSLFTAIIGQVHSTLQQSCIESLRLHARAKTPIATDLARDCDE